MGIVEEGSTGLEDCSCCPETTGAVGIVEEYCHWEELTTWEVTIGIADDEGIYKSGETEGNTFDTLAKAGISSPELEIEAGDRETERDCGVELLSPKLSSEVVGTNPPIDILGGV